MTTISDFERYKLLARSLFLSLETNDGLVGWGEPVVERRYHSAAAIHRGPLTFSLPIDAERKQIGGEIPHTDWEFYPTEPWSYGLELNLDDPASSLSVAFNEPGIVPFSPESAPVTASFDGQLVADWGMASDYAWADTVPSVVVKGGRRQRVADADSLRLYESPRRRVSLGPISWLSLSPVQLREGSTTVSA